MKKYLKFNALLVLSASALLTTACSGAFFQPTVSPKYYKGAMETWIGLDVNGLISQWGPPSNVYEMPNGNKLYTWLKTSGTVVVTEYNYWLNQSVSGTVSDWCKTTFEVNTANQITKASWEGNNCVAHRPEEK